MYPQTHDVYITDSKGRLINRVTVYSEADAVKLNMNFDRNWRISWEKRKLKKGDLIVSDDAYVIKVSEADYYGNILHLETGSWYLHPKRKDTWHISTELNFARIKKNTEYYIMFCKFRLVVREFLTNGYDLDRAIIKVLKKNQKVLQNNIFKQAFMAEITSYFKDAKVDISKIIKILFDRISDPEEKLSDVVEATKLLFAIHPDVSIEENKGLFVKGKTQGVFLGEHQFIKTEEVKYAELPSENHGGDHSLAAGSGVDDRPPGSGD